MTDAMIVDRAGAATGGVRTILRIEGLALFAAGVAGYAWTGGSWWLFAGLFLAPDLAFVAYLGGPRWGAFGYNLLHATIGPVALTAAGLAFGQPPATAVGLVWLAHVGFDRALGYGLKYSAGFGLTHLGRIGRQPG